MRMSNVPRRVSITVAALLAPASMAAASMPVEAPRPNIVFIMSDDQGWADVGYRGSEIETPNIDRLAAEGVRLEQFYTQPLCSPTRAAFLTGRYPIRYGLHIGVVRPHARHGLPVEERTLAQALREAGYETAITGKWHLGQVRPEYLPTRRGFDHQYGLYTGNFDYFTHLRDGSLDWHRDDHPLEEEGYATELIAAEASRLIAERDPRRPLFLYVAFNAVHSPFQAPEHYMQRHPNLRGVRRTYAGMVAAMDDGIGRIVDALEKQGMRSNTLIIFCSDNGGPSPGEIADNGPLRSGKGSLYEGGVRVPAVAVWDGYINPGSRVDALLHMVDWYPTLVKLAGGSLAQQHPLDGRDAWAAIAEGAASPRVEILVNISATGGAIRVGDWKLVVNGHVRDGLEGGVETPERREAKREAIASPVFELFNLKDDPSEATNLAATHPEIANELRARLDAHARAAAPSLQAPAAPGFQPPKIWGPE